MDIRSAGASRPATAEAVELRDALAKLNAGDAVQVPDDWPAPPPPLPSGEALLAYVQRAVRHHPTVDAIKAALREALRTGGRDPAGADGLGLSGHMFAPSQWTLRAVAERWPIDPPSPPEARRVTGIGRRLAGASGWGSAWDDPPREWWDDPSRPPPPPDRATRLRHIGNRALAQLLAGLVEAIRAGALELRGVRPDGATHERVPPFEMDDRANRLDLSHETLGPREAGQKAVVPRFRVLRVEAPPLREVAPARHIAAVPATGAAETSPAVRAVPPSDGWTLMEAAAALCPEAAQAVLAGGEDLDRWCQRRAVRADAALPAGLPPDLAEHLSLSRRWAEARFYARDYGLTWLGADLLAAVCARPDLTFSGRDATAGIGASRKVLTRDDLLMAGDSVGSGAPHAISLQLEGDPAGSFARDALVVRYDPEHGGPALPDLRLVAVRVERVATEGQRKAVASAPEARSAPPSLAGLLPFDRDTLRVQYMARIHARTRTDSPFPSEEEDLAWARSVMADVGRQAVRDLRKAVAPKEATKRGPRGPRNRRN